MLGHRYRREFRRSCGVLFERKLGLAIVGGISPPAGAVRRYALGQFAAPDRLGGLIRYTISARLLRGRLRRTGGSEMRITKSTDANSGWENRATLQASFIHRCVLRCGRFHSGVE